MADVRGKKRTLEFVYSSEEEAGSDGAVGDEAEPTAEDEVANTYYIAKSTPSEPQGTAEAMFRSVVEQGQRLGCLRFQMKALKQLIKRIWNSVFLAPAPCASPLAPKPGGRAGRLTPSPSRNRDSEILDWLGKLLDLGYTPAAHERCINSLLEYCCGRDVVHSSRQQEAQLRREQQVGEGRGHGGAGPYSQASAAAIAAANTHAVALAYKMCEMVAARYRGTNPRMHAAVSVRLSRLAFALRDVPAAARHIEALRGAGDDATAAGPGGSGPQRHGSLELLALELQLSAAMGDHQRLKDMYFAFHKSITDERVGQSMVRMAQPSVLATIFDCGGLLHLARRSYEDARHTFLDAFRNYEACRNTARALRCLKYSTLCAVLSSTDYNLFDHEPAAKTYADHPEILEMSQLLVAYLARDAREVARIMTTSPTLRCDDVVLRYTSELVVQVQSEALRVMLKAYSCVTLSSCAARVGCSEGEAEAMICRLVVDGAVEALVDQVGGTVYVGQAGVETYSALQRQLAGPPSPTAVDVDSVEAGPVVLPAADVGQGRPRAEALQRWCGALSGLLERVSLRAAKAICAPAPPTAPVAAASPQQPRNGC